MIYDEGPVTRIRRRAGRYHLSGEVTPSTIRIRVLENEEAVEDEETVVDVAQAVLVDVTGPPWAESRGRTLKERGREGRHGDAEGEMPGERAIPLETLENQPECSWMLSMALTARRGGKPLAAYLPRPVGDMGPPLSHEHGSYDLLHWTSCSYDLHEDGDRLGHRARRRGRCLHEIPRRS